MDPSEHFESSDAREQVVKTRIRDLIDEDSTTYHFGPDDDLVGLMKFLSSHP